MNGVHKNDAPDAPGAPCAMQPVGHQRHVISLNEGLSHALLHVVRNVRIKLGVNLCEEPLKLL